MRCYLEITNICNLDCLFCPKTGREKRSLTMEEFDFLTSRLQGRIKFLYFHLMGEPMLHRHLPEFVVMARERGFIPVLTTNGTLLSKFGQRLLEARPHKVQISLHSHEGNLFDEREQRELAPTAERRKGRAKSGGFENPQAYISEVMHFSITAAQQGVIVVLRLWNEGGYDKENELLHALIAEHVPGPWTQRYDGWKLADNLYLEYDGMFEWPDSRHDDYPEEEVFCYALRNQIGVLVDGSVVPCCLDHDGDITLGNLFTQSLDEILQSPRARAMYEGFSHHKAVEPLCRKCGYASVAKRFRK